MIAYWNAPHNAFLRLFSVWIYSPICVYPYAFSIEICLVFHYISMWLRYVYLQVQRGNLITTLRVRLCDCYTHIYLTPIWDLSHNILVVSVWNPGRMVFVAGMKFVLTAENSALLLPDTCLTTFLWSVFVIRDEWYLLNGTKTIPLRDKCPSPQKHSAPAIGI